MSFLWGATRLGWVPAPTWSAVKQGASSIPAKRLGEAPPAPPDNTFGRGAHASNPCNCPRPQSHTQPRSETPQLRSMRCCPSRRRASSSLSATSASSCRPLRFSLSLLFLSLAALFRLPHIAGAFSCPAASIPDLTLALSNPGCSVIELTGQGLALTRDAWDAATLAALKHTVLLSRDVTIRGARTTPNGASTLLDCGYLKGRIRVAAGVRLTLADLFLLNCRQPAALPVASGAVDLVSLEGAGSQLVVVNATLHRSVCAPLAALAGILAAQPRPAGLIQGQAVAVGGPMCLPALAYAPNCWNESLALFDYAQNGTFMDASGALLVDGGGTTRLQGSNLVCGRQVAPECAAGGAEVLEACIAAAAAGLNLTVWDAYDLPANDTGAGGQRQASGSWTSADGSETGVLLAFIVPTVVVGWGLVLVIVGLLVWSQRRKSFSPCPEAVKEAYEGVVFVGLAEGSDEQSRPPTVGDGVAAVTVAGDAKRKAAASLLQNGTDSGCGPVWGTTTMQSIGGGGAGGSGSGGGSADAAEGGDTDGGEAAVGAGLSAGGGTAASGGGAVAVAGARIRTGGGGYSAGGVGKGASGGGGGGGALPDQLPPLSPMVIPLNLVLGVDVVVSGQQSLAGRGSYGTVLPGRYGSQPVAVRLFHRDALGGSFEELRALKQDIEALARHQHPNLVALLGAGEAPGGDEVFMMEEPMVTNLARVCHDGSGLSMERVLSVALDISLALAYLHPAVIHRNLKPSSVLLDSSGAAKLTDYGLLRLAAAVNSAAEAGQQPEIGTAQYMAPECFRGRARRNMPAPRYPVTPQSDIFSFGVLLWELLSREKPWRGMNAVQVALAVGYHNRRLEVPVNERFPPKIRKLILQCWEQDPHKRPTAAEVAKRLSSMIQQMQQPLQTPPRPRRQPTPDGTPHGRAEVPQARGETLQGRNTTPQGRSDNRPSHSATPPARSATPQSRSTLTPGQPIPPAAGRSATPQARSTVPLGLLATPAAVHSSTPSTRSAIQTPDVREVARRLPA